MSVIDQVVRFAVSPQGAAIDRHCVRWLGHSPVSLVFARASGQSYNRPLLLTTKCRKTGRRRSVVLPYFPAGESIAVVGSRGGMPTDPHWVVNLRADSACEVRLARQARPVQARIASGAEREGLWAQITARAPVYLEYQERARGHREIPVVILDAVAP